MTDQTIVHRLDRDGPLKGIYRGLTMRPDDPSQPGSLNHPVALVDRVDGKRVGLPLDSAALAQKFTDELPSRGQAIGAYRTRSGGPDIVTQRLDYLDAGDDDGGAGRRADEGILLKLANARYNRTHPGASGDALTTPAAKAPQLSNRSAPALGQFANPYRDQVVSSSLDVPFSGGDFIDGLGAGLSLSRSLDGAGDPQLQKLAELERRHGPGTVGARPLGTR